MSKLFLQKPNLLYCSFSDLVVEFIDATTSHSRTTSALTTMEREPDNGTTGDASTSTSEPTKKKPKLFANYAKRSCPQGNDLPTSAASALGKYLVECSSNETTDCLAFWKQHRNVYQQLLPAVFRTMSIPASSAPVERVFSYGGIFLRPHRSRMSDKLLSSLVFVKCNTLIHK